MQENYLEYEELKKDVIEIGLQTRFDVVCYMSALGMPIKAVAISYCQRLLKEGIIKE
jgi:hypothetical protein